MGNSGSVAFVFNRMGEFKLRADGINQEEFEMEAIDFGMEEMGEDSEGNLIVRTAFEDFGRFSEFLESWVTVRSRASKSLEGLGSESCRLSW